MRGRKFVGSAGGGAGMSQLGEDPHCRIFKRGNDNIQKEQYSRSQAMKESEEDV